MDMTSQSSISQSQMWNIPILKNLYCIYIYIYYILVLHFVYENGSNPAVGTASLALGLLCRSRHHGVGLPCPQRNFSYAQAGRSALARFANVNPCGLDRGPGKGTCECATLFTTNIDISSHGCQSHQVDQSNLKHNLKWAGHTCCVPVHARECLSKQDCSLYAHTKKIIPCITLI